MDKTGLYLGLRGGGGVVGTPAYLRDEKYFWLDLCIFEM